MAKSAIKEKLVLVINECFKKAEEKNFRDLNFSFPKNKTPKEFYKTKINILYNIDEYSQHFLSIHTKAKVALREFQQIKFDGAYLELLRLVLNLSDRLAKSNLKSIRVYDKNELAEMIVGDDVTAKDIKIPVIEDINDIKDSPLLPVMKNTRLIKEGTTGKKLQKTLNSLDESIEALKDIEL